MNKVHMKLLCTAVAVTLLAACASKVSTTKVYDKSRVTQFSRLLVVSVTGNTGERQRLEDMIAIDLRARTVYATESYKSTGLEMTTSWEDIRAAITETNSDGVIITNLAVANGMAGDDCGGNDVQNFWGKGPSPVMEASNVTDAATVVAEINLYDAKGGVRVWSQQSYCFDKSEMERQWVYQAREMQHQLEAENFVK